MADLPSDVPEDLPEDLPEDVPADVARAATQAQAQADPGPPAWLGRAVRASAWRIVWVLLLTGGMLWVAFQLRHLLGILAVALFLALAMIPGVNTLTHRFKMRRGAAVGLIYLAGIVGLTLLVAVIIPAIARFAGLVRDNASDWYANLQAWGEEHLGLPIVDADAAADGTSTIAQALLSWADDALGLLTSGLGLVFDLVTVATFAFFIAVEWPKLLRAILSRMPPARQYVAAWIADTSIRQTGGYFYSRLLLMVICGAGGFAVMLIVGLPLAFALPLAVFMGFVSVFIPFVGTYIGAAVPILIVLAVNGLIPALVLLAWVLVYQQAENYWLSPRISSQTMELSGAVAFGGALAGGALAGPLGAFMALPVAALITAIVKNTGRTYEVVAVTEDGAPTGADVSPAAPGPAGPPSEGSPPAP
ncbi:AI-2E family transporter [Demequina pelophila]|uniref:AI-2E family transporter n=1 Tax=Demequina pelophila TaxID=1638984 RepID=UPI0007866C55|nr:AI-2E family transporter [Demequina pelophila]